MRRWTTGGQTQGGQGADGVKDTGEALRGWQSKQRQEVKRQTRSPRQKCLKVQFMIRQRKQWWIIGASLWSPNQIQETTWTCKELYHRAEPSEIRYEGGNVANIHGSSSNICTPLTLCASSLRFPLSARWRLMLCQLHQFAQIGSRNSQISTPTPSVWGGIANSAEEAWPARPEEESGGLNFFIKHMF